MKNIKKILSIVVSMLVLLVMVSCGGGKEKPKESVAIEKDKEMVFNSILGSNIKTLDISKATDASASFIFTQVMDGLTRVTVGEDGEDMIEPALAKSWDISDDGLTWTFHLRNTKWWDGKPVTAHDFEYSIKRTLNPETASTYAFILAPIKNADEYNKGEVDEESVGVKALDDNTLEITLKSPCGYFLDLTYYKTLLPQRKDIVDEYGGRYGAVGESVIANGPYILSEWLPNNKVTLIKNENYWDADSVKLDRINLSIVSDTNAIMNMLLNGQIDIAGVSKPEWIKKFEAMDKFDVLKGYTAGTNYAFYNQTDNLFGNAKVRKAFSLAIDREDLGEVIFKGIMEPAYGWVPPKLQIGGREYRGLVKEPLARLKAEYPDPKVLLKEGLEELGIDIPLEELEVTYLNAGTNDWSRTYFEYMQQMYKRTLGVEIKADFVEWPVFQKKIDEQEFQMAGMAWIGDYNDPYTFLEIWASDSGIYDIGYNNPKYDELMDLAENTVDNDKRLEYFREAENILLYEDSTIAPTLYRRKNTFIDRKVKGVAFPLFGGMDLKYAYIKEE